VEKGGQIIHGCGKGFFEENTLSERESQEAWLCQIDKPAENPYDMENPAQGRPEMEYVNAALIVIGFFIIGYYQKQKIGALEKQLNSQKELIGTTKAFFDLFDLEKLKGYGEILEKKVRTEMEGQVAQIKNQFLEEQKKYKDSLSVISDELSENIAALIEAMFHLSRDKRLKVVQEMKGKLKPVFLAVVNKINEAEAKTTRSLLASILTEGPPKEKPL
jgi:hypothetical protein